MTSEEVARFLAGERVVSVATLGPDGWPHLAPLWYVVLDGELWASTYAKSQKVRNLERDPRATLLVEAGDDYRELRGVMLTARAEICRDPETVLRVRERLFAKYERPGPIDAAARERLRAGSTRHVVIRFRAERVVSWDHRKERGAP